MENKYVLIKLVGALNTLSDSDLSRLAVLLKQPKVNEALVKLIENTLELRMAERTSRPDKRYEDASEVTEEQRTIERNSIGLRGDQVGVQAVEDVQSAFVTLLQDRSLFPSTKDVVDAVNRVFQWGIDYEEFRKRGRRDLINKYLHRLSLYPDNRRIKLLKSFFYEVSQKAVKVDKYSELFKILAGYE